MKDLDFDELDRAVASALGDQSTSPESVAETSGATAPATTSAPSISAHSVHSRIMPPAGTPAPRATLSRGAATTQPASSSVEAQESTAPAPVTKRIIPHRAGRALDVVHPGAVPSTKPTPVAVPSVEEKPTEEPATPASVAEEVVSSTPAPNPDLEKAINELLASEGETPVADTTPVPKPETTAPETLPPETAAPAEEAATADPVDEIAAALEAPVATDAPAADSPFLPDAKVEKRPLGSSEPIAHELPTPSPAALAIAEEATTTEAVQPPSSEDTAGEDAPLPEELQGDLLAIESGAATGEKPEPVTAAPAEESKVTGPTSIARQYKDKIKQASEDDETGAVFDPETYQQPIEHPAKKSSGWGWVIAILFILVLAVGAAVAAYFAGILPVPL